MLLDVCSTSTCPVRWMVISASQFKVRCRLHKMCDRLSKQAMISEVKGTDEVSFFDLIDGEFIEVGLCALQCVCISWPMFLAS